MAPIKVKDLAYGRLRAPDLDVQEEFLTHFGMTRAARTPNALYMRGTDPFTTPRDREGGPAFVGFAYYAASEEDLHRVAKAPGASAVESDRRARRGQASPPEGTQRLPDRGRPRDREAGARPRGARSDEHGLGAPAAGRHAHASVGGPGAHQADRARGARTPKVKETVQWFRDTLGFHLLRRRVRRGQDNIIGSFNRCDCGDEYVDHHTLFCVRTSGRGSTTCRSRSPTSTRCSWTTST